MNSNVVGFVDCLCRLDRNADTAALAKLRGGIGDTFDEISSEISPWLAPFVEDSEHYGKFALIGGLFAQHRMYKSERETLGAAFTRFGDSDSTEKRFKSLLSARNDEIIDRLRQAIGLAKSREIAIDYQTLLYDLLEWENPVQPVQFRWARGYWRVKFDAVLLEQLNQQIGQDTEQEAAGRKSGNMCQQELGEKHKQARLFAKYLQTLQNNRASLSHLRRGLGKPLGDIDMLPYVASFLPENRCWEYPAYFLTAALFGLHPLSTEQSSHDMGHVFRILKAQQPAKEATHSLQRRFTALLDADRRDLAHHLRQAVSLAKSVRKPVEINYRQLLLDIIHWDKSDKSVQRRWAKHFFFDPKDRAEETDHAAA